MCKLLWKDNSLIIEKFNLIIKQLSKLLNIVHIIVYTHFKKIHNHYTTLVEIIFISPCSLALPPTLHTRKWFGITSIIHSYMLQIYCSPIRLQFSSGTWKRPPPGMDLLTVARTAANKLGFTNLKYSKRKLL